MSSAIRRLVVSANSVEQAEAHAAGLESDVASADIVSVTELGPRLYEVLVRPCPPEFNHR